MTARGGEYGGICSAGDGVVFRFDTQNGDLTELHGFGGTLTNGDTDGVNPYGSLTLSGKTLYGMTWNGGANTSTVSYANGAGVIFELNPATGVYNILHSFGATLTDGENPASSLTRSGQTLYGMTQFGGAKGYGVIFSYSLQ